MRGPGGKKEVSVLAWPLAIGMLSFTVMGVTDTLLMGHVGTDVQAGVGLATTLAFTFMAFFRGLTGGAQSLISAADGAGNWLRVRQAAGAALAYRNEVRWRRDRRHACRSLRASTRKGGKPHGHVLGSSAHGVQRRQTRTRSR